MWYSNQLNVGLGNIGKWLKKLCETVGIGLRTNHKLRHYAPTRMAEAGLPRHMIAQQTRHKSESSLNTYIDNSITMKTQIASGIAGGKRASPDTPVEAPPAAKMPCTLPADFSGTININAADNSTITINFGSK